MIDGYCYKNDSSDTRDIQIIQIVVYSTFTMPIGMFNATHILPIFIAILHCL